MPVRWGILQNFHLSARLYHFPSILHKAAFPGTRRSRFPLSADTLCGPGASPFSQAGPASSGVFPLAGEESCVVSLAGSPFHLRNTLKNRAEEQSRRLQGRERGQYPLFTRRLDPLFIEGGGWKIPVSIQYKRFHGALQNLQRIFVCQNQKDPRSLSGKQLLKRAGVGFNQKTMSKGLVFLLCQPSGKKISTPFSTYSGGQ